MSDLTRAHTPQSQSETPRCRLIVTVGSSQIFVSVNHESYSQQQYVDEGTKFQPTTIRG